MWCVWGGEEVVAEAASPTDAVTVAAQATTTASKQDPMGLADLRFQA
jgi:hypothetical protein